MKDPTRLLDASASELELQLLRAGATEQPPLAAMQRLVDKLGVGQHAAPHSGVDVVGSAVPQLASKLNLLPIGIVAMGMTLTAALWLSTRSQPPAAGAPPHKPASAPSAVAPVSGGSQSAPSTSAAIAKAAQPSQSASNHGPGSEMSNGSMPSATGNLRGMAKAARRTPSAANTGVGSEAAKRSTQSERAPRVGIEAATRSRSADVEAATHSRPSAQDPGVGVGTATPATRSKPDDHTRAAAQFMPSALDEGVAPAADPSRSTDSGAAARATRGAADSRAPSLALEIARLDAIRRALASGRSQAALAALRAYQDEFPSGTLRQEAEVLSIEAHERAGDRPRARALAARFLAEHPQSPHSARVHELLAGLGPDAH